ncbi:DUF839 domain-containing protein [Variovorax dokdonensis]|uniref:DUF839 domain-containing protein n=1 Tax=Variovorax dokdonensis TaxID=344883 RepID=A0ABT7N9P3_9BURK|nr:alkaline phosphatase PhoX [Variovorax dokdonensis]MDM0044663.1 DUF839 domain-containing protein [Variovorax dokdonensis]
MTDTVVTYRASRRQALKLFAAPLLPLGGAALLTACGGSNDPSPAPAPAPAPAPTPAPAAAPNYVSTTFSNMAAPTLDNAAAMATTTVGSIMTVAFDDNSKKDYALAYKPFFITGDMVPNGSGGQVLAGGYFDINNQPIMDNSVPGKERQFFSDCPDGTSLLALDNPTVAGIKGKAVFAVVQFEYTSTDQALNDMYGKLPSPIAVLTLDQDQTTGKLELVKYHNVDMSSAHGLWITCGASLSPWNTHLSSEEYEPDAFTAAASAQFKAFSKNVFGSETAAKPYLYGHLPEITVNPDGTGKVTKHYCLGRISHELVQVMPDNRTVLMGDDATNGGLFVFIADKEKDLSAGTLYAAKYQPGLSIDPSAAPAAIDWINLGHATSAEIEALANTTLATDIFDLSTTDPMDASYTLIYYGGAKNWIKLKPGMEKAAAFLETHRYAALVGASMAFTKMEGTTVNIADKMAYSALANIQDSMITNGKGWTAGNNIGFAKTLKAGGVLGHRLSGGLKDTGSAAIDSEWMPASSHMVIVGEDITADANGNTAAVDKIASPDNLKFSEKMRTLFIGEDSGNHVNNYLWAYNVDTKTLSRIMSTPAGAESTGLHAVDEINGWTYIMSNFQHPGDFIGTTAANVKTTLDPLIRANYKDRFGAAVGYLTADPMQPSLVGKAATA